VAGSATQAAFRQSPRLPEGFTENELRPIASNVPELFEKPRRELMFRTVARESSDLMRDARADQIQFPLDAGNPPTGRELLSGLEISPDQLS